MADEGSFCVPCAVFRAYCAPGGPEQNQRRQRLAHPERPLCPISVLPLSSGKLIRKLYFLPPNVPTPPDHVSRGRAQQSMRKERKIHGLSYPKRIGQRFVFWVSQPVAAAARTRPFSLLSTRNDRTASISAAAGFTPRWTYIIL